MRAASPSPSSDTWRPVLIRAYLLGALGGGAIAEVVLWAPYLATGHRAVGDVPLLIGWSAAVAWLGGLVGIAEAMITLTAVLLIGPLRRCAPVACLVGGSAAAALPLWLTFRDGWPRVHGSLAGIAFCCITFLAGAVLIWPVLTGRPPLLNGSNVRGS